MLAAAPVVHRLPHKLDEMLGKLWITEKFAKSALSVLGPLERVFPVPYGATCTEHGTRVGRNRS